MSLRFSRESLPPAYDKLLVPKIFDPWARILLDAINLQPGEAVLDVATGPGTVARAAAARVGTTGRVVGVDISQPMLSVARTKPQTAGIAAIEYIESPATDLRVPAAAFDVVLCQQGLQFFPDRRVALTEMRRALKPGGRLGVAVWASPIPTFGAVREALTECGGEVMEQVTFGRDPDDLPRALQGAGFDLRQCEDVTLTVTYEGGIDEVIEHIPATPSGPGLAELPPARHHEFRQRLAEKLEPWTDVGTVIVPTVARVAIAVKVS